MEQTDITYFKNRIEDELSSVTEELQGLGVHNPENPEDWIATPKDTDTTEADENTSADHAEELDVREATLADLEYRYNELTEALQRIEQSTYGICEISGQPIEHERLNANPAARTCIAHKDE